VDAQKQYFLNPDGGPTHSFSPRLVRAGDEASGKGTPFCGYFFRVLRQSGPKTPDVEGGNLAAGEMTSGFVFIAYPASYRTSGVMTFIVGDAGVTYEKDLGPNTEKLASTMTAFHPDPSWHEVD